MNTTTTLYGYQNVENHVLTMILAPFVEAVASLKNNKDQILNARA